MGVPSTIGPSCGDTLEPLYRFLSGTFTDWELVIGRQGGSEKTVTPASASLPLCASLMTRAQEVGREVGVIFREVDNVCRGIRGLSTPSSSLYPKYYDNNAAKHVSVVLDRLPAGFTGWTGVCHWSGRT